MKISGLILAGGLGRRMGSVDKGLVLFNDRPMIASVIERFVPQVDELVINANRNFEIYERFGYRVVRDSIDGFAGPLAGIESGLANAMHDLLLTCPCDSPFLPINLGARLCSALETQALDLAVAKTGNQAHPVFCIMRKSVHQHLRDFLAAGGRKIDVWYSTLKMAEVNFDDVADAFANINTEGELKNFERKP